MRAKHRESEPKDWNGRQQKYRDIKRVVMERKRQKKAHRRRGCFSSIGFILYNALFGTFPLGYFSSSPSSPCVRAFPIVFAWFVPHREQALPFLLPCRHRLARGLWGNKSSTVDKNIGFRRRGKQRGKSVESASIISYTRLDLSSPVYETRGVQAFQLMSCLPASGFWSFCASSACSCSASMRSST